MPYDKAVKCFDENLSRVGTPGNDLLILGVYKLSAGLVNLTQAVQRDVAFISARFGEIERHLQRQAHLVTLRSSPSRSS